MNTFTYCLARFKRVENCGAGNVNSCTYHLTNMIDKIIDYITTTRITYLLTYSMVQSPS